MFVFLVCDQILHCLVNQFVSDHECTNCSTGRSSEAGAIPDSFDTSCTGRKTHTSCLGCDHDDGDDDDAHDDDDDDDEILL